MFEPLQLVGQCGVDARLGMAEQVDPPGTDGVEIAPAVAVVEPAALRTRDGDDRQRLVLLHLRAGMPYRGAAAL